MPFKKRHIVSRDDHGCSPGIGSFQQLEDFSGALWVEVSRRFIRQKDLRVIDHGARDSDPLLLTTGELQGVMMTLVGQTHTLQEMHSFFQSIRGTMTENLKPEGYILFDRSTREKLEVLKYDANIPSQKWNG